ncbi:MAG TPA: FtsX-like permease family protein [Gaiellaceae bacterium]|nr:FtsX-like permease family protein [Gaiellaceae bacterium]
MIGVTLKGLMGRKLRAFLTALAVVIGVAMVSGSFVLTDTMRKAFDGIFTESYEGTDAVINGKQIVDFSSSGRATVSADLLDEVRALTSVEAAAGEIADLEANSNAAKLVDEDGKTIGGGGGAPSFGVGLDTSQLRFSALELTTGEWAKGGGQVVIDANTADKYGYGVGDRIGVAALGPVKQYEITGVARFGSVDSIGGATIAVFDLPTAQALFKKENRFDAISVAAKEGVTPDELVRDLQPLLPPEAEVTTGDARAAAESKDTASELSSITYILVGFGGVALFVGAFVIFNTLSITVAQRTREFATLRTLGGSRRQVLRSVILEGFVIGLVAAVVGLLLGVGLAKGMNALFVAFGIDLPQAGTVIATRTIVVSLLVGTVVTVLASIVPAVRATRVPPILAVREGSTLPKSRLSPYVPYMALLTIAVSITALGAGLFASGLGTRNVLLLLGLGVVALFIGVALLSSRLVRPLAALVGWPAGRIAGSAGRLARENAVRNPSRTAATAAALMIGLALVSVVAVLGASLRDSANSAVEKQLDTDYALTHDNGFDPFPADAGDAIAAASGVELASSVRFDQALAAGSEVDVTGVDPTTIARFYDFEWAQGSEGALDRLGGDGAIVTDSFADDRDLSLGSRFAIETPSGDTLNVVVRGIYEPPDLDQMLGPVSISQRNFESTFARPRNLFTFVNVSGGESDAATTTLETAVAGFPDAVVRTKAGLVTNRTKDFSTILQLLYVLLGFSVVVSLFGMVNTLVLSVFERTRELGMLRAVGMTRRQARQMIRHESVITALIGAALGLPLGVFLAALVAQALSQYGVGFSLPVGTLAVFALVAVLAGVLAAVLPARRASRLNVLKALQYE